MLNPDGGGAERVSHEIGRRLVARGHEVHLVTGGSIGLKKYEVIDGIQVHRYGRRLMPHFAHMAQLRKNGDADIIIDDLAHAAPWFSPWLSKTPGIAFFYHLHSRTLNGQTSSYFASLLSFLERNYPFIYRDWPFVTFSLSSESDLKSIGIDPDRIFNIPLGVDTNLFHPSTKSKKPSVVYFGGMRPYKRPEHVLIAFSRLLEMGYDASLTMIGDGSSRPFLEALSTKLGIRDTVSFTGKISDTDLSSIVSQAWVNVYCSLAEGWGLSIIEAAASATPTVAYRAPGVRETIDDGNTGYLVSQGNTEEMALAIAKVFELQQTLSRTCKDYAQRFSWETTTDLWESMLYNTVSIRHI